MLFRQKSVLRSVVQNFKPHTSSNLLVLLSPQKRNKSLLPTSSSSNAHKKNVRNNTILAKTPNVDEVAEAAAAEYTIQNVHSHHGPATPAQQTPPSPINVSVGYEAPKQQQTQQAATTVTSDEVEVKDASLIFQQVIKSLEGQVGRENLTFPKEIYFLVGAPGSGKGTMTKHIMHERGLTAGPIVASDLLSTPEMRALKDKGILVSDKTVIELVLKKLLEPQFVNGVVVDGFPRTTVQAECISMLYDFMHQLRKDFISTDLGENFRRPVFRITVLFVDEKVSIDRQLKRGEKIREQNKMAREAGVDIVYGEERATDVSVEAAKKRYQYFKEHIYQSLKVLKQKFPYNLIDASGPIQVVAQNLIEEFQYQSSMELGKETFDALSAVPPVEELTLHARQQLVRRLDNYLLRNEELFTQVLHIIEKEFLHIMRRQALTGVAVIRSENEIFSNPAALNMALDIFAERGYQVILDLERKMVPVRVNPTTFEIETRERRLWHFQIQFERPKIRQ